MPNHVESCFKVVCRWTPALIDEAQYFGCSSIDAIDVVLLWFFHSSYPVDGHGGDELLFRRHALVSLVHVLWAKSLVNAGVRTAQFILLLGLLHNPLKVTSSETTLTLTLISQCTYREGHI